MVESERAVAPRARAGLTWRPRRTRVARANTCRIITPSPWKLPRMQESEDPIERSIAEAMERNLSERQDSWNLGDRDGEETFWKTSSEVASPWDTLEPFWSKMLKSGPSGGSASAPETATDLYVRNVKNQGLIASRNQDSEEPKERSSPEIESGHLWKWPILKLPIIEPFVFKPIIDVNYMFPEFLMKSGRKRAEEQTEEQKRAEEPERWLLRHLLCTFQEPLRLERCGTDLLLKPGMKSRGGFYAGYYATKPLALLSIPQMKIRAIGVQDFEVPAVLVSDVSKDWSRQTDTESFPGAAYSLHDKTGELQNGDPSLQGQATFSCEQQSGLAYTFPMRDTRVYCSGVLLQGKGSDDLELPQYSGVPLQGNGGASSLLRPRRGKEIYEHSGHPGVLGNVLGSCKPALTTCFFASTLGAVGAIAPETARDGYMQAGGSKSDTSNFWFGVVACVGVLFAIIGVVVAIMQLRRSRRNQTVTTPTRQTLTMQRRSRVQYIVEEETVHRIDEMA